MSQFSRPAATGNGISIIQSTNLTPTPRPNIRRAASVGVAQPAVSLAEYEALKRRLDATEAMVNALVAGSQPRGNKRPKFPMNNLLRSTVRTIYSRLERKFTFPDSMQSDANMPVLDAIVRLASEGIDFCNEFCDSVGALRASKHPQVMAAVTTHYDTQRRKWKNAQKKIEEQQKIVLEQKCLRRKQRASKLDRRLAQYDAHKEGKFSEFHTKREYLAFLELDCMSDEEDGDVVNDVAVTIKVTIPSWRSEELNGFLKDLDDLHNLAYPKAFYRPRNRMHTNVALPPDVRSRIYAWGIAPNH